MFKLSMLYKESKVRHLVETDNEYKEFFKASLKKFKIKDIASLSDEKKKEFFTYIDKNWKGKSEK